MESVYNKLDLLSLRDETVEVSIRRSESSSARPRLRCERLFAQAARHPAVCADSREAEEAWERSL